MFLADLSLAILKTDSIAYIFCKYSENIQKGWENATLAVYRLQRY